MYQVQTKAPAGTGWPALNDDTLPVRCTSVDAEIARHCAVLDSLREPVLQRVLARIAKEHVPVAPSRVADLGQVIDNTLLDPVAGPDEIAQLCAEAAHRRFATVSVNSRFVSLAAGLLENTNVGVCATVAFPFGTMSTEGKVCEARSAAWDGAAEVEVVLPTGLLKAKRYQEMFADILYVRQAVEQPVRLGVVLETGLLDAEEMIDGALLAVAADADFVTTSTGFVAPGPSLDDVRLLRGVLGGSLGIKVMGTIRTWDGARSFLLAGASRIATSRGAAVMTSFLASRRWADQQFGEDRRERRGRTDHVSVPTLVGHHVAS